tara:strand:- start:45 stop:617 length:573 start_codon:yes stop_codon:yes gene_type:complete
MKKKVPEHNGCIFPKLNQNSNFKVIYEYDDWKAGHDNSIFGELNTKLKEKKWIALNGKEFDYSGFIDETQIFYDANENLIQNWNIRIWQAQNFKLKGIIGELDITYDVLEEDDKRSSYVDLELFINNDLFEKLENLILNSNTKLLKKIYMSLGFHIDKKDEKKKYSKHFKDKVRGSFGRVFDITHYQLKL